MRDRRGLGHDLSMLSFGQAAAQLANLVALVYLARTLGAHGFGIVQIGVAFSAYALIIAEWGMMFLGIREVARLESSADVLRYVRTHLGLLVMQAAVVLAVGSLVLPRFAFFAQDRVVFWLYLAVVVPQAFMLDWVVIGLERMTWAGIAKAARSLLYAGLVVFLLVPLADLEIWPAQRWVPVLFILAFGGGNLIVAVAARHWLGRVPWPRWAGWQEGRRRWHQGAPIGASAVTMRVLLNMDIIVLGILTSPATAGAYAAAARVGFVLAIAMEVLWKALLPRLARRFARSPAAFGRSFNQYLGVALVVLIPAAVAAVALGPALMQLLYGDRFPEAGRVFQNLAISYTMLALAWHLGNALIAQDRQQAYFSPLLVAALLVLVANLVLVPRQGGIGASYAMLLGHAALLAMLTVISRRWLRLALVWPLALAAVAAAAVLAILGVTPSWHVLARGAAALLVAGLVVSWPLRRWVAGVRTPL